MKRKVLFLFAMLLIIATLTACGADPKPPYSVEPGAYEFEKAVITNLITKEVIEKNVDDVLDDNDWRWLLSFIIGIKQDTKFIYNNNRHVVLDCGNAYELIANNTLKLHFPRWEAYDYNIYDVVIILGKHQLY